MENESKVDYRATREIVLREDATDIIFQKLGKDTHIGYQSASHPHKYCVFIVEGYWIEKERNNNVITLIEE